jgi:DNA repair protein RadC
MPKRINIVSLKLVREKSVPYPAALSGPFDSARLAQELLEDKDRENFLVIFLDTKHRPIGVEISSIGSASACLVQPGVVFRAALLVAATAVVFAHNHPSGDPTPSPEDIDLTKLLIEAGNLLGVRVLDHLVIGDGRWISIREHRPGLGWS